jgi:ribosome biogenesis protein ERB1
MQRTENPREFLRTIVDPLNQKKIVLSDAQLKLVRSIVKGTPIGKAVQHPWEQDRNPEDDKKGVMFWNVEKPLTSLHRAPEPKRRFMASKHERNTVNKLVHAIKMGWIDLEAKRKLEAEQDKKLNQNFEEQEFLESLNYTGDIWVQEPPKIPNLDPLIAPGFDLPDHIDSFNPAPEFLEDIRQCTICYTLNH